MAAASSPPATPAMSQDSTVFGIDSSIPLDDAKTLKRRALDRVKAATLSQDILIFLIGFRVLNALSIKTFFQPDEYFQSLEPAWEIAFGANSGAWITWEWKNHLRSAIHPFLFAIVYWVVAGVSWIFHLSPAYRADFLIAAPKFAQAICAALVDFYTWKLGEQIFGSGSNEAWAALALTVCSPWQWFCSTRTLSNCLETTLTVVALNFWPWQLSMNQRGNDSGDGADNEEQADEDYVHVGEGSPRISETSMGSQTIDSKMTTFPLQDSTTRYFELRKSLRICLLLAALACILRPTNVLIWICIACFATLRMTSYGQFMEIRWVKSPVWVHVTSLELFPATQKERRAFMLEGIICGSAILMLSTSIDLLYYKEFTFPPLRFLYFNIAQSLAAFYGKNRLDYYLTEGLPLLLTTYLPFGVIGIYNGLYATHNKPTFTNTSEFTQSVKYQLATTSLIIPLILSLISHKEVRFLYPLLPLLHLLAASPFTTFFLPAVSPAVPRLSKYNFKRFLLATLLTVNILIAILTTTSHQPAPISVLSYLRKQHITHYLTQPPPHSLPPAPSTMTAGFLMPCHSTPWRSHLVFPTIKAWALGCEPPVNLNVSEKAMYVDEADRFYAAPRVFLTEVLGAPPLPRAQPLSWLLGWFGTGRKARKGFGREENIAADAWDGRPGRKTWPDYLAFFEEKEALLKDVLKGSMYRECWRGWNSWGHDDWRRRGDVIVWCLRSQKEKRRRGFGW